MSQQNSQRTRRVAADHAGALPGAGRDLIRLLVLIFMLALLLPAQAQTARTADCILSDPNSNGAHVDEICWLQLGASGTSLATPYSQQRTFSLPDGSTIQMTVELAGGVNGGNGIYQVRQAPVWTGSNFSGGSDYYRLLTPNGVGLLSENGGGNGTVLTLRDVKLFRPNGSEVTNVPFELIVADAERLNSNPEFIDFGVVSGGSPWELVEWLGTAPASAIAIGSSSGASFPAPGGSTYQNLGFPLASGTNPAGTIACNPATFIDCLGVRGETLSANANAPVLASRRDISAAATPFTVTAQVHSGAGQAFAVGVRWGGVRLRKSLPAGRLNPADQFVYDVTNVLDQSVISAETAGASAISDYISAQATMPGNTLTLTERMASGSLSTLLQYDRSISCANPGNPGSSTVLPDGPYDPDAPPVVDVLELGDAIECTFSNIPRIIDLVLVKTAPATASAGTEIEYQLAIRNDGTHTATAATFTDTLPVGLGGVSTAGVTCSDEQGGAICGDIAVTVSGSDADGYVTAGSIESLPAGASVVVTVRATPLASAVGTLVNSARVDRATTDLTVGEQDETNNASSATMTVTAPTAADIGFCPVDGGFFNIVNGVGIYQYSPASATDSRVTGLDFPVDGNLNGLMVDPIGRTRLLFHQANGGVVWAYDPTHPTSPGWYQTGATINGPNLPRAGMTAAGVGYFITSATTSGTGATAQMYRLERDGDYGYRVGVPSTLTYDVAPSDLNSGDIAFDTLGVGWLVAGNDLFRVDVDAGTATRQQNFTGAPVGVNYAGAAFGGDGRLYVVNNSGGTYYAMDLAQGTMQAVGTSASGVGRDLASCSFPTITPAQLQVSKTLASIIRDGGTVPAGEPAAPGDLLTYDIEIRHVGGTQAATVFAGDVAETTPANTTHGTVADDFACTGNTCRNTAVRNILPGQSTAFSFVVQVDAALLSTVSQIDNAVTVRGIDCTAAGNDCDETTLIDVEPALTSSKAMTAVNGVAPAGPVAVGDVLTYTVVATNSGNVALPTVTVTDARITPDAITCAPLAAGASCTLIGTYTVTQADANAGTIANTAVITTPDTPELCPVGSTSAICLPTVEIPTETPAPSLTVVKTAGTPSGNTVGSTIGYSFLVTNTGNVTIADVAIDDAQLDAAAVCPVTTLAPDASTTCTGTHTITQAEVDAGEVLNTATATGTPPGGGTTTSPPDEEDVTIERNPSLATNKALTANADEDGSGTVTLGDTLTYTITASNTGTVTLPDVEVRDDRITPASIVCASLAPGADCVLTGTYVVTQADVNAGQFINTATITTGDPSVCPAGATSAACQPTVTIDVTPYEIDANDDSYGPVNGANGDPSVGNLLDNDTLNGVPATPGTVRITLGTLPPGIVADPTTGMVGVEPGTPAGSYTFEYTICEVLNAENCDTATVTVVVEASEIVANDDSYGPVSGADGDPSVGNLLDNDTLNGEPATPGTVTITVGTLPPGIVADPTTGVVGVEPGTPAGSYTFEYTICETLNPENCDTATVTVVVEAPEIDAVDDSATTDQNTPVTIPVLDDDTLNGVPVDADDITIVEVTPPSNGSIVIQPDGTVIYTPNPGFSGDDSFEYRICEITNPDNCATATVTITVRPNVVEAIDDDAGTAEPGVPTPVVVVDNDSSTGAPLDPGSVTLVTPPAHGVVNCANGICSYTPEFGYSGEDSFVYRVCDTSYPWPVCDTATVTVKVEGDAPLRLTKSVSVREVKVGDLVRYTLTVENVGNAIVTGAQVLDTPPQGFTYVDGSIASSDGRALVVSGYNPIRIASLDLAPGDTASISYLLRVGAGIRAGTHINQAMAQAGNGVPLSNVATAQVQTAFDPMLDDSLVFGTVFDDRNGDGWQASAALREVRVQGGFAPDAYVAGSTTIDRGDGPQPLADASAPLLHGVALDTIAGRQSVADPVESNQVVIRQRLRSAAFTDDFVLTSGDGATLRMSADGSTRVERSGDVAKGLSAAEPVVTRRVSQDGDGVLVEYVVGNAGIDERGIPGVRIASVEGLLIETDQYGRYHLVDVPGGHAMHGRNFILKVDPSTLPPGTEFTTANPLVRRVTPGLPVRFDFGVRLPVVELQGGSEVVELELGEVFFAPDSSALREAYLPAIEAMAGQIDRYRGGRVVVTGDGEHEALAFARAAAVRDALQTRVTPAAAAALTVELRTHINDPHALVAGVDNGGVLLGTVLFDTDTSAIRPEFEALLDAVARRLEALGGGVVGIVGHTDVRGSHAYNVELGLRRAQAVFDALSGRLRPQVRAKTRVETSRDPAASVGETRK